MELANFLPFAHKHHQNFNPSSWHMLVFQRLAQTKIKTSLNAFHDNVYLSHIWKDLLLKIWRIWLYLDAIAQSWEKIETFFTSLIPCSKHQLPNFGLKEF